MIFIVFSTEKEGMTLGKERKNTKEIKVAAQIPGNLRLH